MHQPGGSANRAGEAAAGSAFKDTAPVLGHPIYPTIPHSVDRGEGKGCDMKKRKKRSRGKDLDGGKMAGCLKMSKDAITG